MARRLGAEPLTARTRHTVTDSAAVLALVQQARRQGWCVVNQELEEGLISVSAPLHGANGQVAAALNLSGQANRTDATAVQQQLLPPLLEAAQAISGLMRQRGA